MIEKKFFGTISSGQKIYAYTIKNKNMTVKISEYGAAVTSIIVPDRNGAQRDIVLGYDTPAEYEQQTSYIGSTLGRCCNRIANAAFCINGHTVELTRNEKNTICMAAGMASIKRYGKRTQYLIMPFL